MKMNIRSNKRIALIGALLVSALAVVAEENGIGHYNPSKTSLAIEVKWVPQIDVQNPMKGDYVWAKVAVVF